MSYLNPGPLAWYPPGAAGVSLTPAGTAWTNPGSWTTLIPATAAAIIISQLAIEAPTLAAANEVEIDIARGEAGAEVLLSTVRSTVQTNIRGDQTITFPIPVSGIGAGDRVSARIRLSTTEVDPWLVTLGYYDAVTFTDDHLSVLPLQALPPAADGVALTMGGAPAWTPGAWAELTSGFTDPTLIAGVAVFGVNSTDFAIDIGTGAAAAEVVATTVHGLSGAVGFSWTAFPRPHRIAASTRVSARLRQSSTAAGSIRLALLYYGAVIEVVPDPGGGGTPEDGTDPDAGISLCGAEIPMPWVTVQMDDGEHVYAAGDNALDAVHKEGRVLSFGTIKRALSTMEGAIETATQTIELSDHDRALRAAADAGTLLNKRVDTYASTRAGIIAGSTPRRLNQGMIRNYKALPNLRFRLELEDFFSALLNIVQGKKLLPQRTLSTTDFPNLPDTLVGKAVPIGYGLLSDEDLGSSALGVVPLTYVGDRFISGFGTAGEFLAFGHATPAWQSLFIPTGGGLSTGTAEPSRTKITTSIADAIFPGSPGYASAFAGNLYNDWNSNRYQSAFLIGPRKELAADGRVPLAANVPGIEDVGDGTGDMIDSLPLQIVHLLTNFMLQNYTGGNWLTIPDVPVGSPAYSRISTSTFDTVHAHMQARLPTEGYQGAFMLGWDGRFHAWRDVIRDALKSGDWNMGINKDGQIIGAIRDPGAAVVKHFSDVLDIVEGSFDTNRDFSAMANRVTYRYAQRYVTPVATLTPDSGEFLPASIKKDAKDWLGEGVAENATSIANHATDSDDGVRNYDLDMPFVRAAAVADNVAAQVAAYRGTSPIDATHTVNLCGTDVELGDLQTVDHHEGPTATGWTAQLLRTERIEVNLDEMASATRFGSRVT